jgi:ribosomal protein S18 acetylase RimI-like enzyme
MITIRTASISDLSTIQKLSFELFRDNAQYDHDLIVDWPFLEAGEKYFKDNLENPQAICLISEEDSNPVGYIVSSPKELSYRKSKYFEINDMCVLPEYRSQGIGSQLIKRVEQLAKEQGYQRFFVGSYAQNSKAIAFYQKNGFEVVDVGLEKSI